MSKMIIHCVGGTGINIGNKASETLKILGKGFAEMQYLWVDTSSANMHKVCKGCRLQTITSNALSENGINGSGGERSTNAKEVMHGVKEYMDANGFLVNNSEEFHFVIYSGSGGSGSTLGPILVKELLGKDMSVVAIMVGDDKDLISARNTLNTFKSIGAIAKMHDATLSLYYRNNNRYDGREGERFHHVDNDIVGFLSTMALFLSGKNEAIDNRDVTNFIDMKKYKSITVPTGVYFLESLTGTIVEDLHGTIVNTRTLLRNSEQKSPMLTQSLHDKTGIVIEKEVFEVIEESNLPISIISKNGCLTSHMTEVEDRVNVLTKIEEVLVIDELEDSDTGLIL